VVYATGAASLGRIATTGAAAWHRMLATNVVGASLVVAAALDHLRRGTVPTVALLSSATVDRPWPWLIPYEASKAALDVLGLGLQAEEPWLRVVRIAVGPTLTGFGDGWDPELAEMAFAHWAEEAYLDGPVGEADALAASILATLDPESQGGC
jgi:NAD(P)-dependent dehydrogenase (short-subunit alcohol dehydrogenase family)